MQTNATSLRMEKFSNFKIIDMKKALIFGVSGQDGSYLTDLLIKKKYLVPKDLPMNQFVFIIRKRIKLDPSQTLFVMVNNSLVSGSELLGEVYETKKDTDGFLYMKYSSENTFG